MTTIVRRVGSEHTYRQGRGTLEQRFHFEDDGADAHAIADVLLTAPLIGKQSVFGRRPGREEGRTNRSRSLRCFSPAPGFRFDLELTDLDGSFVVRFSQPEREVPYLQGELVWLIADGTNGPVLSEHINTPLALDIVSEPLGGARTSLRRWLFFQLGHEQVMRGATRNIAALLNGPPDHTPRG